jgi:hypothetical protein
MSDPIGFAPKTAAEREQMLQSLLRIPMQRFYANGFGLAQTNTDMSLIMLLNGQPVGMLSMSYISAKSLMLQIKSAVETFEKAIGHSVKTGEEIGETLQKLASEESNA